LFLDTRSVREERERERERERENNPRKWRELPPRDGLQKTPFFSCYPRMNGLCHKKVQPPFTCIRVALSFSTSLYLRDGIITGIDSSHLSWFSLLPFLCRTMKNVLTICSKDLSWLCFENHQNQTSNEFRKVLHFDNWHPWLWTLSQHSLENSHCDANAFVMYSFVSIIRFYGFGSWNRQIENKSSPARERSSEITIE
jgi:hypothetical protein